MAGRERWLTLGRIERSRGRRGELIVSTYGVAPERFRQVREVYLFGALAPGEQKIFRVEEARSHKGRLVAKLEGIDSIEDAERLRGAEIRIPHTKRRPAEAGEYFLTDLVGCQMVERATSLPLGEVESWLETAGGILLSVRQTHGGELLIPFARSICVEIDLDRKRIVADLPEGLKELNQ